LPDPTPIRGRWTLGVAEDGQTWMWRDCIPGSDIRPVEVVPVPDEQAIERAARALASRRRPLGYGLDAVLAARIARQAREDVLVVLAAALEQPE
jgi:hypothetical protein